MIEEIISHTITVSALLTLEIYRNKDNEEADSKRGLVYLIQAMAFETLDEPKVVQAPLSLTMNAEEEMEKLIVRIDQFSPRNEKEQEFKEVVSKILNL